MEVHFLLISRTRTGAMDKGSKTPISCVPPVSYLFSLYFSSFTYVVVRIQRDTVWKLLRTLSGIQEVFCKCWVLWSSTPRSAARTRALCICFPQFLRKLQLPYPFLLSQLFFMHLLLLYSSSSFFPSSFFFFNLLFLKILWVGGQFFCQSSLSVNGSQTAGSSKMAREVTRAPGGLSSGNLRFLYNMWQYYKRISPSVLF